MKASELAAELEAAPVKDGVCCGDEEEFEGDQEAFEEDAIEMIEKAADMFEDLLSDKDIKMNARWRGLVRALTWDLEQFLILHVVPQAEQEK